MVIVISKGTEPSSIACPTTCQGVAAKRLLALGFRSLRSEEKTRQARFQSHVFNSVNITHTLLSILRHGARTLSLCSSLYTLSIATFGPSDNFTPPTDRPCPLNTFRTAVSIWGQTSQILSNLFPKRDCSPKRVDHLDVSGQIYIFLICMICVIIMI